MDRRLTVPRHSQETRTKAPCKPAPAPDELPPPPLPMLVTGIAGVAGYQAFRYFHQRFPGQVVGTRRCDNWRLAGEGIEGLDAGDTAALQQLFDRYRFRSVLNAEGHCRLRACELDPALAHRVNVRSAHSLTRVLSGRNVRLVHLSIDLVFSGLAGAPYREDNPPDPVTVYGQTMWETEQHLMEHLPCCILRISLPMGRSFSGHAGAIDWIESRFRKGKPATLYYDEIRTPHYADCLNRLCHDLLRRSTNGVFHASGPRALSLFQIAQIINRVGDYDPSLLMGCYRTEAGAIPPRAGDVRLDSSKLAQTLGYAPFRPWPSSPDLVPAGPDWHFERPDADRRHPRRIDQCLAMVDLGDMNDNATHKG